jgi:hypothetical protein
VRFVRSLAEGQPMTAQVIRLGIEQDQCSYIHGPRHFLGSGRRCRNGTGNHPSGLCARHDPPRARVIAAKQRYLADRKRRAEPWRFHRYDTTREKVLVGLWMMAGGADAFDTLAPDPVVCPHCGGKGTA